MENISYGQILTLSFAKTKSLLFEDFSLKRWLKLAFVALMSAQLVGGGSIKDIFDLAGLVGDIRRGISEPADRKVEEKMAEPDLSPLEGFRQDVSGFWASLQDSDVLFAGGFVLLLVLLLFICWLWISARFQFVWLQALLTGDLIIKKPFHDYQKEGREVFIFSLLFNAFILIFFVFAFAGLFGIMFPLIDLQKTVDSLMGKFGLMILSVGLAGLVSLVFLAGLTLLFYVNHLVIPIMALARAGMSEGFQRVTVFFRERTKDMIVMALIYLGLTILLGVAGLIGIFVIVVGGALVAAAGGSFFYFLFYSILSVQYMGPFVLTGLGVAWLAFVIAAVMMSLTPYVIFLRYFTLHFLAALDPAYQLEITYSKFQTTNKLQ